MKVYCLEEFKSQFEKLKKNKSYRDIESEIVNAFFDKQPGEFYKNGAKLSGTLEIPFIKKRLSGRGGWRLKIMIYTK